MKKCKKIRLGYCDFCSEFDQVYAAAETTAKRKQVHAAKQKHLAKVKKEKEFLARKMTLAIFDPTMYHFTATDKMSPFKLPHF